MTISVAFRRAATFAKVASARAVSSTAAAGNGGAEDSRDENPSNIE
jgi:hypothetical protein